MNRDGERLEELNGLGGDKLSYAIYFASVGAVPSVVNIIELMDGSTVGWTVCCVAYVPGTGLKVISAILWSYRDVEC